MASALMISDSQYVIKRFHLLSYKTLKIITTLDLTVVNLEKKCMEENVFDEECLGCSPLGVNNQTRIYIMK
jgi:hypothetical protein